MTVNNTGTPPASPQAGTFQAAKQNDTYLTSEPATAPQQDAQAAFHQRDDQNVVSVDAVSKTLRGDNGQYLDKVLKLQDNQGDGHGLYDEAQFNQVKLDTQVAPAINQAYQKAYGRDATDAELTDRVEKANQFAKANPDWSENQVTSAVTSDLKPAAPAPTFQQITDTVLTAKQLSEQVDSAQSAVDKKNQELATDVAQLGEGVTEEQKQAFIANFKDQPEYHALTDAKNKLADYVADPAHKAVMQYVYTHDISQYDVGSPEAFKNQVKDIYGKVAQSGRSEVALDFVKDVLKDPASVSANVKPGDLKALMDATAPALETAAANRARVAWEAGGKVGKLDVAAAYNQLSDEFKQAAATYSANYMSKPLEPGEMGKSEDEVAAAREQAVQGNEAFKAARTITTDTAKLATAFAQGTTDAIKDAVNELGAAEEGPILKSLKLGAVLTAPIALGKAFKEGDFGDLVSSLGSSTQSSVELLKGLNRVSEAVGAEVLSKVAGVAGAIGNFAAGTKDLVGALDSGKKGDYVAAVGDFVASVGSLVAIGNPAIGGAIVAVGTLTTFIAKWWENRADEADRRSGLESRLAQVISPQDDPTHSIAHNLAYADKDRIDYITGTLGLSATQVQELIRDKQDPTRPDRVYKDYADLLQDTGPSLATLERFARANLPSAPPDDSQPIQQGSGIDGDKLFDFLNHIGDNAPDPYNPDKRKTAVTRFLSDYLPQVNGNVYNGEQHNYIAQNRGTTVAYLKAHDNDADWSAYNHYIVKYLADSP